MTEPGRTKYLDAKMIRAEFGLSRDTAYRLMRKIGYAIDLEPLGMRKKYVLREQFEALLEEHTVDKG